MTVVVPLGRHGLALGVVVAIVGIACATSEPATDPGETLGFLENYEQLAPGRAHEARLLFIDDEADFSTYERAIVDPVIAWHGGEQEEGLARVLDGALREELAAEFDLVEAPQPGTLRLRSALAMKSSSLLAIRFPPPVWVAEWVARITLIGSGACGPRSRPRMG